MNAPSPHDRFPIEWLAAYADGELPAAERKRVEAWLAIHPDAREILEAQKDFSPSNTDLFPLTVPIEPGDWKRVLANIEKAIPPRRTVSFLPIAGASLVAASLLLLLTLPLGKVIQHQQVKVAIFMPEVEEEIGTIQLASEDEIEILSMPESAAPLLLTGKHPLATSMVTLASSNEIEILGMGSDSDGRFPEVTGVSQPTEAVLLWAPRDR